MYNYYIEPKNNLRREILIKDRFQTLICTAKQKISLTRNRIIICDENDEVIAEIERMISLIVPLHKITIKGEEPFYIKRDIGFRVRYLLNGRPWEVRMDGKRYSVRDTEMKLICEIIKEWEVKDGRYKIEVTDEEYSLDVICIAIAVDASVRAIGRVR